MKIIILKLTSLIATIALLLFTNINYAQTWQFTQPNLTDWVGSSTGQVTGIGIGNFATTNISSALHINTNLTAVQTGTLAFTADEVFRTQVPGTTATNWRAFRNNTQMFRFNIPATGNGVFFQSIQGDFNIASGNGTPIPAFQVRGGSGGDAGNVGIGNYSSFTPTSLLHVHQNTASTASGIQLTNATSGIAVTDGLLLDVDATDVANISQRENQPMRFQIRDQTLMNNVVRRAEFTYGGAMRENQLTTAVDGFRIWNPGYTMSTANSADHALDLWCGASNTTHIRFDNSGLIQTINLRFEQIARLDGFWFDAKPYTYQAAAGSRGSYFFNMDSIEISRFSNVNNTNRGFMRIGLQPAGLLGSALGAINAARRLEVYDNAAVPQFRITQTDGTNYTDFQTTTNGDLFIDPWSGSTSRNVGIGLTTPTAKLEVNSPTVSGGSQTTVKVDNINTGAVFPVGIEIDVQGTTGAGLTQAVGMDININSPVSSSSTANSITNSCSGGSGGVGVYADINGANTNNYGFRSSVSNGTAGNYGGYLIGNGGTAAYGLDCYASNGTTDNFAIKSDASGASGSSDARGITTSAQGSTTNYGGYFYGLAASSNTAYGTFSIANNGNTAYGLHAAASGATTNNYGINASSSGGVNSYGINASSSGGVNS